MLDHDRLLNYRIIRLDSSENWYDWNPIPSLTRPTTNIYEITALDTARSAPWAQQILIRQITITGPGMDWRPTEEVEWIE